LKTLNYIEVTLNLSIYYAYAAVYRLHIWHTNGVIVKTLYLKFLQHMRIDLHVNMYEPTNDLPDLTMIIWSTQGWHKSTNKQSYSYNISTI